MQYVVMPGDTMSAIARRFGVSLETLLAANPTVNKDWIYPGQIIHIPGK